MGARPNLVKLAPIVRAARDADRELAWIHTGQHARRAMRDHLVEDLGLPPAAERLVAPRAGVRRIERMTERLAPVLADRAPSLVAVFGDVDSTVAAARAARDVGIPVAHVEAGLRAFERGMPEERNRIEVDRLSARLHVTEPSGRKNLRAEGTPARRIHDAGNVMADALAAVRATGALASRPRVRGLPARDPYVVATLHRQALVEDPARLARAVDALARVAARVPVVFPVHPRTARRLGLGRRALGRRGILAVDPLRYVAFLALTAHAAAVVTDSGGLQVEASLLGVPCLVLRRRTEHLLALERGTCRLLGPDPRRIPAAVAKVLATPSGAPGGARRGGRSPRAWDGRAAGRIVADWVRWGAGAA